LSPQQGANSLGLLRWDLLICSTFAQQHWNVVEPVI
jgi:hypothetical protein